MSNVTAITKNVKNAPREPKIVMFLHCGLCMEEVPEGESMQDYAMEEVGYTVEGIQIWCRRHNANIIHLDFAGQKFDAIEG